MIKKSSRKSIRGARSSDTSLKESVRKEALKILRSIGEPTGASYAAAREILNRTIDRQSAAPMSVNDGTLFLLSCALSDQALPGYATLDTEHINQIHRALEQIKRYSQDPSRKRPLNFLLLAAPGAGKSHFVECIARKLGDHKIGPILCNMVVLQRHEDLIPPLDAARNLKVEGKIPLLFLDEFDSRAENFPLLLPLLWDGGLTLGQHDLKLGKVIIVLAGSDARLPDTILEAANMRLGTLAEKGAYHPKLVDLLSRINGEVLRIPQLSSERRADKICIAVRLLRHRFGSSLRTAPLSLIRFIADTEFRYGVRSVAHLVELVPHSRELTHLVASKLGLPLGKKEELKSSSLAYHLLSEDQAVGVVNFWKECSKVDVQVPVAGRPLDSFMAGPRVLDEFYAEFIVRSLTDELQRDRTQLARRKS
jgi:hypothetical protein